MRRVVVTGIGVVSAVGLTATEFFDSLIQARSGVGEITQIPTDALTVKVAAEVKGFDPSAHFAAKQMGLLDRFAQFLHGLADQWQIWRLEDRGERLAQGHALTQHNIQHRRKVVESRMTQCTTIDGKAEQKAICGS